jgi:hypothetical protein
VPGLGGGGAALRVQQAGVSLPQPLENFDVTSFGGVDSRPGRNGTKLHLKVKLFKKLFFTSRFELRGLKPFALL